MNKILILSATHGDEDFSIPIINKLKQTFKFDWIISNPRALKLNKRFYQSDLNRSGPGNLSSKKYEVRRAFELINIAKKYDYVIDIHGTLSNTGVFIILPDPNWENIELAKKFDIKNIVLWPSLKPTGPLTQFIPNSLEIECGPKNLPKTARELENVLKKFLKQKPRKTSQNFYIVTGKVKTAQNNKLKSFKPTRINDQTIIPLMPGQYQGFSSYCLQKLKDVL